MKRIFFFILITLFVFVHFSCGKTYSSKQNTFLISGKWNVLIDSNYKGCTCVSNGLEIYKGGNGDYYDFNSDGNLYIKEGNVLDTLSYHVFSDTTMIIATFGAIFNGIPDTCHISNFTAHTLIITAPVQVSPAGEFGRTVHLMH